MKKILLSLAAALMFAVPAVAQDLIFPDELSGSPFTGTHEYLQFRQSEHFRIPYSLPAPNPNIYWVKAITGGPINIHVFTECLYNVNDPLVCSYISEVFSWNGDAGAYCNMAPVSPSGDMSFDCYSWDSAGQEWDHYYGLLEFIGDPHNFEWGWGFYFLDTAMIQSQSPLRIQAESEYE